MAAPCAISGNSKTPRGNGRTFFGANGSHYSLGKQFALKQTYELRCKITNPAGKISYTEIIETQRTAEGSGDLQSKDSGPAIESESLMDAGEEITVANTASQGSFIWVLAAVVVVAVGLLASRAIRRRR